MSKSWTFSLIVSAVVSFAILALYRFTEIFVRSAVWLEDSYSAIFVLPTGAALSFHQPLQFLFFATMAFLSAWVCLEMPRVLSRLAYLAGAAFLTLLLSAVLAFCGVLFEPFSGIAATL
ncbi:MAG: hypothetical protein ACOYMN_25275, partial [Roseimicrobium sp.]